MKVMGEYVEHKAENNEVGNEKLHNLIWLLFRLGKFMLDVEDEIEGKFKWIVRTDRNFFAYVLR